MSSIRTGDYFSQLKSKPLPKETIGACKNAYKRKGSAIPCQSYYVVLGDGLCMKCWDRGLAGLTWTQIKELRGGK